MERMPELRIRGILPGSDLREKSDLNPTFEKEPDPIFKENRIRIQPPQNNEDPTSFLPSQ